MTDQPTPARTPPLLLTIPIEQFRRICPTELEAGQWADDLRDMAAEVLALSAALAEARREQDIAYECRASGFIGEDGNGCGFGSNSPGYCPNCACSLTPVTWRDRAMLAVAQIPPLRDRVETAESALAEAREEIARLQDALKAAIDTREDRAETAEARLAQVEAERDALIVLVRQAFDEWRTSLVGPYGFTHSDGLKFVQMIDKLAAVSRSGGPVDG